MGNGSRFYREIVSKSYKKMVSQWSIHDFPTTDTGNPHGIPVNQIPCKYYNGN